MRGVPGWEGLGPLGSASEDDINAAAEGEAAIQHGEVFDVHLLFIKSVRVPASQEWDDAAVPLGDPSPKAWTTLNPPVMARVAVAREADDRPGRRIRGASQPMPTQGTGPAGDGRRPAQETRVSELHRPESGAELLRKVVETRV